MCLRFLEMMSNKVGFISCIVIVLSNLGIYKSFIISLKSFIFKKYEIDWYNKWSIFTFKHVNVYILNATFSVEHIVSDEHLKVLSYQG